MFSIKLFILFIALISADLPKNFKECKNAQEALTWVEIFEENGSEPFIKEYVSIAMNNAWWDACEKLVLIAHEKKVDVSSSVYRTSSVIKYFFYIIEIN